MFLKAIVGFPGSGKSYLLRQLHDQGYEIFDDLGKLGWAAGLRAVKERHQSGQMVAFTDIELCCESKRAEVERSLGAVIQWIYFANDPWRCAKNCLYRYLYEEDRPVKDEIEKIQAFAQTYRPPIDALEVFNRSDESATTPVRE